MQNVSQNGRFQVMVTEDGRNHSSTLAINSLTATDSGIIQCVAHNSLGVDSADTTLSVLSKYFSCYKDCMGNLIFGLPALLQVNECLSTSMQIRSFKVSRSGSLLTL